MSDVTPPLNVTQLNERLAQAAADLGIPIVRLLGYANEPIMRTSYAVSAVEADPTTVNVLEELLES